MPAAELMYIRLYYTRSTPKRLWGGRDGRNNIYARARVPCCIYELKRSLLYFTAAAAEVAGAKRQLVRRRRVRI